MGSIVVDGAKIGGVFELECWRVVKPGEKLSPSDVTQMMWSERRQREELRRLVGKSRTHNVWTDEGLDRLLDVFFHATTQTTTWYCLIFESDTTPDGDTNYDVPVFTESVAYDEATRPEYEEAASSSQSTTNSANKATFTMSDTKTIYGAALVSVNTKGDHTVGANNVLAVAGQFAASRAVLDDDVLNLTYTVTSLDDA